MFRAATKIADARGMSSAPELRDRYVDLNHVADVLCALRAKVVDGQTANDRKQSVKIEWSAFVAR